MNEIPLLFAPIPVEPQQAPMRMRFKAIMVNGMLMLAAVLAAILVGTLNLKDLSSAESMELAAAVLAILGVLYLIFRWARPRRP
jgi:lysozyme family protein